ncbi:MAG TPA: glycosyltransferase family 2 protein, partial [Verrucomicrobiae bacterium]
MTVVVGCQLTAFAFYTKIFAIAGGLLPADPKLNRLFHFFTLEKGIVVCLLVLAAGLALLLRAVWLWKEAHFGPVPSMEENLRRVIPAATLILLGVQGIFSCFFLSVLGLKTTKSNQ